MRIFLLAPLVKEKEYFLKSSSNPFSPGQGQYFWYEALRELKQHVKVFRYTDSFIIPNRLRISVHEFLWKTTPLWMGRLQRFWGRYYYLSLENIVKNCMLLFTISKFSPDVLFVSGGAWNIFPLTLRCIKLFHHIPIYLFSGIDPYVVLTPAEKKAANQGIFDTVFSNDTGFAKHWQELGIEKAYELPVSAIDPSYHKVYPLTKKEKAQYASEICFVGSLTPLRQETLKELTKFPLKIWGDILPGNPLAESLKPFYQGKAYGKEMLKIHSLAKIALNLQPDMFSGGNLRTFEIPSTKTFQITDKCNPQWFTDKKDIVLYSTIHDLKKKLTYYLAHEKERKSIALAGYRRVNKQHTYAQRFEKVFQNYETHKKVS